jgi:hypothetical protein
MSSIVILFLLLTIDVLREGKISFNLETVYTSKVILSFQIKSWRNTKDCILGAIYYTVPNFYAHICYTF